MDKKRFLPRESALHAAAGYGSSMRGRGQKSGRGADDPEGADSDWGGALSVADRQRAELWAAELPLLVQEAGRSAGFTPRAACRLLTQWGRLARLDRRALPRPDGPDDALFRATDFIRDNGPELAEAAATSAGSAWAGAWVERAGRLRESYAEGGVATDRESAATSLLLDLDDRELVDYACRRFGLERPGTAEALAACRRWVADNADAFLSCGPRVRAELALMRRDLPAVDRDLARTAVKFLQVRSAVEEMEYDLSFGEVAGS